MLTSLASAHCVLHRAAWMAGCASEGHDALLLVVDDHFILLDDRPDGPLPTVTPGENGHPEDRGALAVLAAQAEHAAEVCPTYIVMNACSIVAPPCCYTIRAVVSSRRRLCAFA